MVRRKSKRNSRKRFSFRAGALKSKHKRTPGRLGPSLIRLLKITSIACAVVGVGLLLMYADRYVRASKPVTTGPVVLMDVPGWVGEQLKVQILAQAGAGTFRLDENAAGLVAEKLKSSAWLENIRTLTTAESIEVYATYRKPVAIIKSGLSPFYVDANQVVLDYVPMPHLIIVEIKGLSLITKVPRLGQVWRRDDLNAAIKLIDRINRRDRMDITSKPLLAEIAGIDVSNYNGNKNSSRPHIVFYTKGGTEIQWGAELGAWQKYLESTDEQKLAKLFGYYKEKGTLSGGVKYINLRDPRDNIPLPVDGY